ncbi:hypothetical protein [Dehalobacter sp.]|uniref:hypothetical protein n=1 Tax=Dehalobacter sp. TaxID=1962289 RepID=UPI00258CF3C8|nr:hypothetical protein [Dehalobacter sp.]MDJ0304549.1 hypothetical protein [Dehalobacter sp.]
MDWSAFNIPINLTELKAGFVALFSGIAPIVALFLGIVLGFFILRGLLSMHR